MDWIFRLAVLIGGHYLLAKAQSFDIVPHEPHNQQLTSAENWRSSSDSSSEKTEDDSSISMWPYPTYKPISWERYYANEHDKHISLTSGLAAGITIGVFFAVFLLTFGCRLYSQRSESMRRLSARSIQSSRNFCQRRLSVSDFFTCSQIPPPPPYDVALNLPTTNGQQPPPPFTPTDETCNRGNARPV